MIGGDLDCETACLRSAQGIQELGRAPADLVITSFMEFYEEGFTTRQWYEIPEKLMNLNPDRHCNLVIIPIELSKVGRRNGQLVVDQQSGRGSRGLLDFLKDKGERRYVVITEKPTGNRARIQRKILGKWEEKGLEIVDDVD
jgi:hypothetical protein